MIKEIDQRDLEEILAQPGGFETLGISSPILTALSDMGFSEPMPVQKACIPAILSGQDIIGQARTGTGKTVAFGVPIAQRSTTEPSVQALILTPTRELCLQVAGEVDRICTQTGQRVVPVYGGQPIERQLRALERGAQIVVGTPGRVIDHIRRRTLVLDGVRIVVLDEADEMLDMGFIDDIRYIMRKTPATRQTCLFSATMPDEIRQLAIDFMGEALQYNLSSDRMTVEETSQIFYEVPEQEKFEALCSIIDYEQVELGLVFCRTRWETHELGARLKGRGYVTLAIHGDMSQSERERAMREFRNGRIEILVATDVAARGIDVSDVTHVINFHIPQDPLHYVHRIGRTGRAGKTGTAITLVTPKEYFDLYRVQTGADVEIEVRQLPDREKIDQRRRVKFARMLLRDAKAEATEPFVEVVEELAAELDARTLAAALLGEAWTKAFPRRRTGAPASAPEGTPPPEGAEGTPQSEGRVQPPYPERIRSGPRGPRGRGRGGPRRSGTGGGDGPPRRPRKSSRRR